MKNNSKLLPIEIALIIGLVLSLFAAYFNVCTSSEDISTKILRLHIIANSDAPYDQNLKLKVRDEILKDFDFNGLGSLAAAKESVLKQLPAIENTAQKVVEDEGYNYTVKASLTDMFFDTKQYDQFIMPAGNYNALRITIGNAQGHNWWCVLYPPLCVNAAQPREQLEGILNEDEQTLVENNEQYDVRFAVIEIFEKIKNFLFK